MTCCDHRDPESYEEKRSVEGRHRPREPHLAVRKPPSAEGPQLLASVPRGRDRVVGVGWVEGERHYWSCLPGNCVVQTSVCLLLPEIVRVEKCEEEDGEYSEDRYLCLVLYERKAKGGRNHREQPTFGSSRGSCHARHDGLDEVEVLSDVVSIRRWWQRRSARHFNSVRHSLRSRSQASSFWSSE